MMLVSSSRVSSTNGTNPKEKRNDTADCRINGKPERLTWRDQDNPVLTPSTGCNQR
jgi:hypothetical protein